MHVMKWELLLNMRNEVKPSKDSYCVYLPNTLDKTVRFPEYKEGNGAYSLNLQKEFCLFVKYKKLLVEKRSANSNYIRYEFRC
jgi:hypothetical protein